MRDAADLPPPYRDAYEERAAIREYMGEQPSDVAEREAMRETIEKMERERDNENEN